MNEDIDARYRRASAADDSRPSAATRTAILEHARGVAAGNAVKRVDDEVRPSRRARRRAAWIYGAGTLAAAVFAGLLVTPIFKSQVDRGMRRVAESSTETGSQVPSATSFGRPDGAESNSLEPAGLPGAANRAGDRESNAKRASPGAARDKAEASARAVAPGADGAPAAPDADSALPAARDMLARSQQRMSSLAPAGGASAPRASAAAATHPADEALRRAAAAGDVAAAARLLEGAVALEARDSSGRTPLMLATLNGRAEVVDLLLSRGADPKAQDRLGQTPLDIARARNLEGIYQALVRAAAP